MRPRIDGEITEDSIATSYVATYHKFELRTSKAVISLAGWGFHGNCISPAPLPAAQSSDFIGWLRFRWKTDDALLA